MTGPPSFGTNLYITERKRPPVDTPRQRDARVVRTRTGQTPSGVPGLGTARRPAMRARLSMAAPDRACPLPLVGRDATALAAQNALSAPCCCRSPGLAGGGGGARANLMNLVEPNPCLIRPALRRRPVNSGRRWARVGRASRTPPATILGPAFAISSCGACGARSAGRRRRVHSAAQALVRSVSRERGQGIGWGGGQEQPFEPAIRVVARLRQVAIVESYLTAGRFPRASVWCPEQAPPVAERWRAGPPVRA